MNKVTVRVDLEEIKKPLIDFQIVKKNLFSLNSALVWARPYRK